MEARSSTSWQAISSGEGMAGRWQGRGGQRASVANRVCGDYTGRHVEEGVFSSTLGTTRKRDGARVAWDAARIEIERERGQKQVMHAMTNKQLAAVKRGYSTRTHMVLPVAFCSPHVVCCLPSAIFAKNTEN